MFLDGEVLCFEEQPVLQQTQSNLVSYSEKLFPLFMLSLTPFVQVRSLCGD